MRRFPLLSSRLVGASWVLCLAVACGGAAPRATTAGPDAPVPAGEERATLELVVDLEPTSSCEEDFDLALYSDRGIELIQWDEGTGSCAGRHVTIRYLPRRTSSNDVMSRVRELASKVERAASK